MYDSYVCGCLKKGLGFSPIMFSGRTEELVFCDDMMGNVVVSGIEIDSPMYQDENVRQKLIEATKAIGMISDAKYFITLTEDEAQFREWCEPMKIIKTVPYSLDEEFEGSLD